MWKELSVLATASALMVAGAANAAPTTVFINEIHYDNTGTDTGEAIEIAGPAGTDLTGWSVVLYNGNGGAVYNTTALSGVIPNQQNGFGAVVLNYPVNGIQNGSPDGIALVDNTNAVVQFLSYEGSFTAVGGPANGLLSVDIGVAEPLDTPIGHSLRLAGVGSLYSDFTWQPASASTFGAVNSGQTFLAALASPVINEFSISTTGTDVEYIEIWGAASTDYSAYTILEIEGDGSLAGTIDEVIAVGTTGANHLWLANLVANSIENGTVTLLLVRNFSGALGDDLDTNNDGIFDLTPWVSIADGVSVNDGTAGDLTYAIPVLGVNYDGVINFAPGGASRIPNGGDTNTASDWVRNDFDLAGISGYPGSPVFGEAWNTPGECNRSVTESGGRGDCLFAGTAPEPGTLALLGLGLAGLAATRRRKQ